jgi:hypothetical protein
VQASRPETELLLCCARTDRSSETVARIETLLQERVDWEHLLRTAHRHGIAPLLYWHLDTTRLDCVPESALARLRDHSRANGLRNLFLTRELLRILKEFKVHRIPAVPYKGPTLAASVYGNLALREFYDLDILVHQHDVPKAKEVLASIGYQARYRLTSTQEAAFLRSQHEHPFRRHDGKCVVELQWRIAERHFFPLDTERLWERLDRIPLGYNTVLNLSSEDMLLILCVHGAMHAWERLEWICDVAELIRVRREDIGWEQLMAQANAVGGERMLLLGLFLASELLGAALPEKVSQRVRADPTVKALAQQIREQLFRDIKRPAGFLEGYEGATTAFPLYLKVRERLPDKIRYCIRTVTALTGEDWELLPLPRFLFPFYYILRMIRLTGKYGPKILKRFLRADVLRKRAGRVTDAGVYSALRRLSAHSGK